MPSTVSILTYHHIAAEDPAYAYDPGVADADAEQFRRQLEIVARYTTPIGIDEILQAIEGAPLPKNPVMITFDDGYRSCHDVAMPILRAVGIRATFFIASGYINERKLYWWERTALILNQARRESATFPHPREPGKQLTIERKDPQAQGILTKIIKNTPNLDINKFLGDLAHAFDVDWSDDIERKHTDELIMSWDQIRALSRAGMDIESHTRWHRVLQTLDDDTLRDELKGSREDLEAQLGRPVRAVAYPVGRRISHVKKIRDAVVAAGYRVGFTNASGATRIWPSPYKQLIPTDPFDITRLATGREMSDAMFLTQIAVPRLAYIGKGHADTGG